MFTFRWLLLRNDDHRHNIRMNVSGSVKQESTISPRLGLLDSCPSNGPGFCEPSWPPLDQNKIRARLKRRWKGIAGSSFMGKHRRWMVGSLMTGKLQLQEEAED